ncbi:TPA: Phr family secreted Rap phosphatase inhibitor [Bacillus thuringiensis]|jgi:Phr family secreted Rap phosphatase inhibitor|uniref:Phr family secreted Rap phosphatase inhibitor n=1 Tax=Bacillus thuringiensis TaxID=1428 RepID=A0A9X6QBJ3_BACTU|nr:MULTISPECIES: hypothetical protein [Bacillus cereus group]EJQ96431.1 hypothetical protein II5_06013 [Bacillus cereus MSX-A1]ETE94113.1 hypothetical protein C623_0224635 [Bacillus thuringiensis serovar aizawai str. Hu4-2]KAB1371496.1 Phr family secreted Rap phosphatase inhibitor [Bacillus thuringiensis]MBT0792871.1 Phr family secreted Rap phosphatase inhibitor [Bacillus cereus]MCC3901412.1 Phr family secreted Rap phosphatase inhibitor [Bacillus thuringiensis]
MIKIKKVVLGMVLVGTLACSINSFSSLKQASLNGGETPSPAKPSLSVEIPND